VDNKQDISIDKSIGLLLSLAAKKNVLIPGNSTSAIIARLDAILADELVKMAVTDHKNYIDEEGSLSTSAAGLMIQINKHIKAAYGVKAADMNEDQSRHLALLRADIAGIIVKGEKMGLTRQEIKNRIYEAIAHSGADYHWRCKHRGEAA